jgi:tetratricopeptide (TPR) repeat protein
VLYTIGCSLLILFSLHAQTVDQLVRFADEKFEQGLYQLAAREYQRALFFGPKEEVGPLNVATGDCYFELGNFEKAELYYRFASTILKPGDQKAEATLKKSSCQILMGQYQLAIFDLLNLGKQTDVRLGSNRNLLLGIAYYGLSDFQSSKKYFLEALPGSDTEKQTYITDLFSSKKLKRPNPKLAYWLSVLIPGSGQFYSGDFRNGFNSMILTFGLAIFTYQMALNNSILDALLTIFPWWQRYYIGGYNSAEKIAESRRSSNRSEIYGLIYDAIIINKAGAVQNR